MNSYHDYLASLPVQFRERVLLHSPTTMRDLQSIVSASLTCNQVMDEGLRDVASHDGRRSAPPLLTGGESSASELSSYKMLDSMKLIATGDKGRYKLVAIPNKLDSADDSISFIDWLNITFKIDAANFVLPSGHPALSDYDSVVCLSKILTEIFGFGVTGQRPSGLNFYSHSYDVGFNGWGIVCIGGQKNTCMITIKGQGLMASAPGWEKRLYEWLKSVPDSKITRVDLATDIFNSTRTVEDYKQDYIDGKFNNGGRNPGCETLGNWIFPNGKGRTLYIGSRASGKMTRIYEKGLQLSKGFESLLPNWLRFELELKAIDREIPLDVLLYPGKYLAGSYPALEFIFKTQSRIQTQKNTAKLTVESALDVTRHQFGAYIYAFIELFGSEQVLERLTTGKHTLPKRLDFSNYETTFHDDFIHHQYIPHLTKFEDLRL